MNHRPFQRGLDTGALAAFRCSSGAAYEDDVQRWINHDAIAWLNDVPYANFQRRQLHVVFADNDELAAVFAWQDITRLDIDGVWLEVLAVATGHQQHGIGRAVLADAKAHLATVPHDGDLIAGLVHPDNSRSLAMLIADGWVHLGDLQGHNLMVGRIA